jgi:ArsR family transcriptional regulator
MILKKLVSGRTCVSDLQDLLEVSQPNVSQHLALLKKSGLVVCHKSGAVRCYHLAKPSLVRDLLAVLGRTYPAVPPREIRTCRGAKRRRPS